MNRRTTCLYCEDEGKVTQLVTVGHWGVCPDHSGKWLRRNAPPTLAELLALQGMAPVLQDKGCPTVNGTKYLRS